MQGAKAISDVENAAPGCDRTDQGGRGRRPGFEDDRHGQRVSALLREGKGLGVLSAAAGYREVAVGQGHVVEDGASRTVRGPASAGARGLAEQASPARGSPVLDWTLPGRPDNPARPGVAGASPEWSASVRTSVSSELAGDVEQLGVAAEGDSQLQRVIELAPDLLALHVPLRGPLVALRVVAVGEAIGLGPQWLRPGALAVAFGRGDDRVDAQPERTGGRIGLRQLDRDPVGSSFGGDDRQGERIGAMADVGHGAEHGAGGPRDADDGVQSKLLELQPNPAPRRSGERVVGDISRLEAPTHCRGHRQFAGRGQGAASPDQDEQRDPDAHRAPQRDVGQNPGPPPRPVIRCSGAGGCRTAARQILDHLAPGSYVPGMARVPVTAKGTESVEHIALTRAGST
jgi:hypothetical protein